MTPEVNKSPPAPITKGTRSRLQPRWTDHRYTGLVKLRESMKRAIARHVVPLAESSSSGEVMAVDLGCGTMPYRPLFLPYVSRYLGADLPENAQAELSLDAATGRVDIDEGAADLIISTQVLEHVESPENYLGRRSASAARGDC